MERESRLEALQASLASRFAKPLRGHVRPADIARRLATELREHSRDTPSGPLGPNKFVVTLCRQDLEQALPFLPELSADLQQWVADVASAEGIRMLAAPVVVVEADENLEPGQFEVESHIAEPSWQPYLTSPPAAQGSGK